MAVQRDALVWHFNSQSPGLSYGAHGHESIDPFPAYAHEPERVRNIADRVEAAFPIDASFRPTYYLSPFETVGRVNGQTHTEHDYHWEGEDKSQQPWTSQIVLWAKRIPIHPAMTRYLVAHEYGHVLQYWIERCRHFVQYSNDLEDEYRVLRGAPDDPRSYGGGWHQTIGEIFANDFRILIAKVEVEFWPHAGVTRPEEIPAIEQWWHDARRKYGVA